MELLRSRLPACCRVNPESFLSAAKACLIPNTASKLIFIMSAAAPGSPASDAGSDSSIGSSASAAAASGASQATQQEIERADELKTQGNTFFKDKQYSAAIKAYTEALDLHTTAVLYGVFCVSGIPSSKRHSALGIFPGNRAFAHLKLENFGSAIADADAAIRVDPDYLKVGRV